MAQSDVTVVASSASSTTLISSSSRRNGCVVVNDDANRLYVLMGSGTASTSNYSFSLAQNESAFLPGYTGPLTGIWAADGSGNALITNY